MPRWPSPVLALAAFLLVFLFHASVTVPGANILIGLSGLLFAAMAYGLTAFSRPASSVFSRPLDLLTVAGYLTFGVIAIFVDMVQAGNGPGPIDVEQSYAPTLVMQAAVKWIEDCDALLGVNDPWYWTLAMLSPFLYLPFYLWSAWMLINDQKSRVHRNCTLLWAGVLSVTTVQILVEELIGQHASKNFLKVLGGYGPYVLFPLFVLWREW